MLGAWEVAAAAFCLVWLLPSAAMSVLASGFRPCVRDVLSVAREGCRQGWVFGGTGVLKLGEEQDETLGGVQFFLPISSCWTGE